MNRIAYIYIYSVHIRSIHMGIYILTRKCVIYANRATSLGHCP